MAKQTYSIDTRETVSIGGVPQAIRLRGTNEANPILLFLHGGPGVSDRHWVLKYQSSLADVCTMVCWDQRGSGLSYDGKRAKTETMTVDLMVEDAAELVEYLCGRFHQEKLCIVGHSWGSVLGTLLASRHPEHIAAYVGMGQLANGPENEQVSYDFVLNEAAKRRDKKALQELARIGSPKNGLYDGGLDALMVQRNYMTKYGGGSVGEKESIFTSVLMPLIKTNEYHLPGIIKYAKGSFYCLRQLWSEVAQINFFTLVPSLSVPVLITQGRHDQNTPPAIARRWFDALQAPRKEWVWFEQSAHSPIKEEPEHWGQVIREQLLTSGGALFSENIR